MKTAQKIKIVSALMVMASIPGCMVGSEFHSGSVLGTSWLMFGIGLAGFIAARFFDRA